MRYNKNSLIGVLAIFLLLSFGGCTFNATNLDKPYHLNLVEIMDVNFNKSNDAQPQFYVISDSGQLKLSAEIIIPANREIILTITSYDMDNAPVVSQYTNVSGTINNKIFLINGAIASGDNVNKQWGENVSSIPKSKVIHTFTIPSLDINIPIEAGSTVIAVLKPIKKSGTYYWQCMAACGSGKSGWGGAMVTNGWMKGKVIVR
ncbi:MAG TPA: hypothetical protein ENI76_05340 [Ignavibacteria bacterium]|nr:hypothetical protein [Ignavibacteria bacterium]